jgi:iron complex transport system substrate-binding protein
VAGATRYCDRPEAARSVPRVGGILDVSVEAVLAARPDLVIGSPAVLRGRLGAVLAEAGVATLPLVFETAESVPAGVLAIGDAVGRVAEARALAEALRLDLDGLNGRAAGGRPVRVLVVVGRAPLVVAARASFLGDLLERAGLLDVADSATVPFPTWSLEQVIRADPDVVVDAAVEAGDLAPSLLAAGLRAATAGRIVRMADQALIRPGPGTAAAAATLVDRVREAAR